MKYNFWASRCNLLAFTFPFYINQVFSLVMIKNISKSLIISQSTVFNIGSVFIINELICTKQTEQLQIELF
jgi:hypothetical protein